MVVFFETIKLTPNALLVYLRAFSSIKQIAVAASPRDSALVLFSMSTCLNDRLKGVKG
jgi:hypothetical protein